MLSTLLDRPELGMSTSDVKLRLAREPGPNKDDERPVTSIDGRGGMVGFGGESQFPPTPNAIAKQSLRQVLA